MFSEALAQRLVSVSADIADLRAWKQSVYLYERLVLPCAFIAELPQNLAPACIADLPCQIRALLKHLSDIEAFCTDQVILPDQRRRQLMLRVASLVRDMLVKPCNTVLRPVVICTADCFSRQGTLHTGQFL